MESEETFKCEKLSFEKVEHDLSFKLVLIGNTSNIKINKRCWEVKYNYKSHSELL